MKATNSLVVLGLLALVSGLGGLYAMTQRAGVPSQEPAVTVQDGERVGAVSGVDDAITRVLTSLGVMESRPLTGVGGIPDEVVRTLAAFGAPLVLHEPTNGAP
jgi:hypothetical protein